MSDCRKGHHEYGEAQNVGAGILRRVCITCSGVTIDLTNAGELPTPLFNTQSSIISFTARHSEAL